MKAYYPSYFLLSVAGQIQTRQAHASYDDSYLGEDMNDRMIDDDQFFFKTTNIATNTTHTITTTAVAIIVSYVYYLCTFLQQQQGPLDPRQMIFLAICLTIWSRVTYINSYRTP